MAQDKFNSPFGDNTEFDATTIDEPLSERHAPATTQRWQRGPEEEVGTHTFPAPAAAMPPGSYQDPAGTMHSYQEGSLDAALSRLGGEIVDQTSVNLNINIEPMEMNDGPTRESMPPPMVAHQPPTLRGSGTEHKTLKMSAGHIMQAKFPHLEPTALNKSGPLPMPQQELRPHTVGAKGSQVQERLKQRESQPAPIRVDRSRSQPKLKQLQVPRSSLEAVSSDGLDPELAAGARLGNYEIVRKIGQGGMGVVYEAKHLLLPRRVAIKFLLINNVHDEDQIRRFLGEAVASTQIDHKGVVDIYDYGYDERNHAYLVMEFVDGRSLQSVMKRSGQLPIPVAVRIARDVAEILAAAHKRGIVHRDLKPDNILLSRDEAGTDFTKILDFGVAKFVNAQNMTGKTKIGSIIGTPWYMPPEQCQGFSTVDARSDIYALGCVFYQMLCGKVPFAGSLRDVLMAHVHVAPPPPHSFCPEIPPAVEALILRMMAKEATDRPGSMDEVARTLNEFVDMPTLRNKADRRTSVPEAERKPRRWVAPLLAAIFAGLATSGVFYFLRL